MIFLVLWLLSINPKTPMQEFRDSLSISDRVEFKNLVDTVPSMLPDKRDVVRMALMKIAVLQEFRKREIEGIPLDDENYRDSR